MNFKKFKKKIIKLLKRALRFMKSSYVFGKLAPMLENSLNISQHSLSSEEVPGLLIFRTSTFLLF